MWHARDDRVRQATAEFATLAHCCPYRSMAPVLAIADMVAGWRLINADVDCDPVGETHRPIATGPHLVSLKRGAQVWR